VLLSGRHVLVADLGVAKAVSEAGAAPQTLTTAGVAIGTPAYMAPEQAAADPHVDHRADIYALGVLGYELLTGGPPFSGTAQAVLAAQVSQEPAPVTQRRPAVPAPLVELIARCLAKRPADRWQSAQEIVDRLEAMATPGTGTTPTATQLLPAPRARSRIALAAGVVGAAAALSVVALLALRSRNQRASSSDAPPRSRSTPGWSSTLRSPPTASSSRTRKGHQIGCVSSCARCPAASRSR
jgi:serine/threonine-protein kinase